MKLRSDLSFYEIATALRPRNTGLLPVIHNDEIATHLKDACSLLDVAYLYDVAVEQVDRALGVSSDVGVVGYQQDSPPLLLELGKKVHDLNACLCVDIACRLVSQDQQRIIRQSPCDGYALLLSS